MTPNRPARSSTRAWSATWTVFAAMLGAALLAACSGADASAPPGSPVARTVPPGTGQAGYRLPPGAITIAAPAAMRGVVDRISADATRDGTKVTAVYGSSTQLAERVKAGDAVDVFISADEGATTALTSAGLARGAPRDVASNKLVIVVAKGNPHKVATPADLRNVTTLAECDPKAPCGSTAEQFLFKSGVFLPQKSKALHNDVDAVMRAVAAGRAEAGVVFASSSAGLDIETVAIPDELNVPISYQALVLTGTKSPELAEALVERLRTPSSRQLLAEQGFGLPA